MQKPSVASLRSDRHQPGISDRHDVGILTAMTSGYLIDIVGIANTGSHGLIAPEIQEHAGPGGRGVFPELLKILFEETGTDGVEVVAEISQPELLLRGEILLALEHAPTRLLQQRRVAVLGHLRDSAERTSSNALFILATMWKRSRMCSAWEHFAWITRRYGFHMSEQTNSIRE